MTRNMSFEIRNILVISVFCTTLLIFWFFWENFSTQYANHVTWILFTLLCVTFLVPLYTIATTSKLAFIFSIFACIFILPRTALFLVDSTFEPLYSVWRYDYFNVTDFNNSLAKIIISSLAFFVGIWANKHLRLRNKRKLSTSPRIKFLSLGNINLCSERPWQVVVSIIGVTLMTNTIFIHTFYHSGISALARVPDLNKTVSAAEIISFFFNYNSVAFLSILATFKCISSKSQRYWVFGFIILTHCVTASLVGSRASSLTLLLFFAIGYISTHCLRSKLRVSTICLFFTALAVLAPLNVYISNNIRSCLIIERDVTATLEYSACAINSEVVSDKSLDASALKNILYRLGAGLETYTIINSKQPTALTFREFTSLEYNLKNAVDILVPGTPFSTTYNSAMILPFLMGVRDINVMKRNYHETFIMTVWGALIMMFSKKILLISFFSFGLCLGFIENMKFSWPNNALLSSLICATLLLHISNFFNMASLGDWIVGSIQFTLFTLCSLIVYFLFLSFTKFFLTSR